MLYAGVILVVISAITIAAALAVDAYARHGGHRTRRAVAVAGGQEPEGGRAFIAGSSKPAFVADVESAKVGVRFDAALLAKVDAAAKWQGITRTARALFGRVAGADDHESGLVRFVVAETAEDCRVAAVVSPERVMPAVERFGELVERGAGDHSATPETPRDPELAAAEAEAAEQAGTSKSTIWRAIRAGRLSAARTDDGGFAIDSAEPFRAFPPERPAERFAGQDATAIAPATGQTGTGGMDDLAIKLAAAEAELRGLKELLAEVKANRDELRQDRDDWRGRAERILTDQRRCHLHSSRRPGWRAKSVNRAPHGREKS